MTKYAEISAARALDIICLACNEACVDEYGSTLITSDSKTVLCESCGTSYEVPEQVFQVVSKKKCREVK